MSFRPLGSRRALVVFLAPLAAALAACGTSSGGAGGGSTSSTSAGAGGGSTGPTGPCAQKMSECLVDQRGCVEDAGGETAHCEVCPEGSFASIESGHCETIPGTKLSHDFAMFTTQPGEEVLGLCQSWTIGNEEELWVNTVELVQDEASHHSNWLFVPDDKYDGEDGVWKCAERNYTQTDAALYGGVLYAQSTQAAKEIQSFPGGGAVRLPPHARIIGDVHLLNTSTEPVTGHLRLDIYALKKEEVKIKLAPFHVTFDTLDIPPHATSRFTGECQLDDKYVGINGKGMKMKLYYVLPHTHALGTRFFIDVMGGAHDGASIIDLHGFNSEPHGRAFDPPIDLDGAKGIRFGCEFTNPRDESVHWGFGDQEMCEFLGFAETGAIFESQINQVAPDGADGATQLYTGPCETPLFVPWTP